MVRDRLFGFLLLSVALHGLLLVALGAHRAGDRFYQMPPLDVRLEYARGMDFRLPSLAVTDYFESLPASPVGVAQQSGGAGAGSGGVSVIESDAGVEDHYFKASDLDQQARPMLEGRPIYPAHAVAHALQGWVRLLLLIDESGQIRRLEVVDASPHGVFEDAALNAFRLMPFTPGKRAGLAVKSRFVLRVNFSLTGQPSG